MPASEHRFISFDETAISFKKIPAVRAPKALVILVHGMGEHSGRYLSFAKWLAEAGFSSYVIDLRGFGKSGGKRGCVRNFFEYLKDLSALFKHASEQEPGLPIFIMGHSFGGLIASAWLAFDRPAKNPAGLILSSPLFGIKVSAPVWQKVLGRLASFLAPDFTQPNSVNPELLTHDPDIIAIQKKDPLAHFRISARLFTEIERMIRRRDGISKRISCPCLVLQAGDDKIVSREATQEFFRQLSSNDKTYWVFEGWYHEILNEQGREQVFSQIAKWLQERSE